MILTRLMIDFPYSNLPNPHSKLMRQVLLLFPLYRWEKWCYKSDSLVHIAQWVSGEVRLYAQAVWSQRSDTEPLHYKGQQAFYQRATEPCPLLTSLTSFPPTLPSSHCATSSLSVKHTSITWSSGPLPSKLFLWHSCPQLFTWLLSSGTQASAQMSPP